MHVTLCWHGFLEAVLQSLSCVQLLVTPWTAACQASLSFSISQSLLKLMSIKSMMPSNHLILCRPLLLLSLVFTLATWCRELTHWKRPWHLERLRRRRGQQRMRLLDGIIDLMDMSLSKLQETVKDRSLACCSPWGHKELDVTEGLNNSNLSSCTRRKTEETRRTTVPQWLKQAESYVPEEGTR